MIIGTRMIIPEDRFRMIVSDDDHSAMITGKE